MSNPTYEEKQMILKLINEHGIDEDNLYRAKLETCRDHSAYIADRN